MSREDVTGRKRLPVASEPGQVSPSPMQAKRLRMTEDTNNHQFYSPLTTEDNLSGMGSSKDELKTPSRPLTPQWLEAVKRMKKQEDDQKLVVRSPALVENRGREYIVHHLPYRRIAGAEKNSPSLRPLPNRIYLAEIEILQEEDRQLKLEFEWDGKSHVKRWNVNTPLKAGYNKFKLLDTSTELPPTPEEQCRCDEKIVWKDWLFTRYAIGKRSFIDKKDWIEMCTTMNQNELADNGVCFIPRTCRFAIELSS